MMRFRLVNRLPWVERAIVRRVTAVLHPASDNSQEGGELSHGRNAAHPGQRPRRLPAGVAAAWPPAPPESRLPGLRNRCMTSKHTNSK